MIRGRLAAFAFAVLLAGCSGDSPDKLVASAKDYIAKGDFRSAEIQLKSALQQEPTRAEARFLLGQVLLDAGDYASAEKEFRRALEYRYPLDTVYPPLARALLREGNVDDVRKAIGELREVNLTDPAAQAALRTELGYAYLGLRQPKEARAAFTEALAAKPGDPAARIGQARLLGADRDLDGAMKVVEEVLGQTPQLAEALLLKAEIHIARGETDAALDALREVIKVEPRNGNARYTIVALLVDAKKYDEANAELGAMKKVLPRDIRARYLEALIAFRRGEPAKAKDPILQVLRMVPDHPPSLLVAGAAEYQLGQFATAEDHLRKVVGRFPGNLYARNMLALTYLRLGQPGRAQETIQPALAAAPKDPSVLRVAGQVAVANNDPKRATDYLERAAAAAKDDPGARIRLGAVRLATGDSEGALRDLEAAAALDGDAYMAEVGLIVAHVSRKEYDKALAVVDRFAAKQPKSGMPENMRGLVLLGKGDRKAARAAFEKALQLQPDLLPAAATLARLDIAERQPDAARKRLEAIVAKTPTNDQALLALAEVQAATGVPPKEVLATVDRAVTANPNSTRARLMQIALHARMNNPKGALAAAQSAAEALPSSPQILEALGRAQLAAGEPNQAIATFNKLATLLPQSPGPLMLAARAHVAKKDFSAATETLRKALAVRPGRLDVYQEAIATYIAAGKPEAALADARAVQKARPKEAIGFLFEGEILITEKKFDQAARAYGEAIKRQPGPLLVLRQRSVLEAAGRRNEGEALLARWVRENPKDTVVPLYLADRALLAKDYKAAASGYERIVAEQPGNAVALNNLAWTLYELKDPSALGVAEKAVRFAPRNVVIADTYGWLLVESGDTKRGIEILGRASKAAPNAHEIRLHYAKALIKSGDKAGARKELEAIATLTGESPHKVEAADLLKQL
jgi:putative PEP-CTERM system TPR-repeat lipoprotein